ncbi:hypothetical protein DVH24_021248 [Malus domestica]|uniref:Retrotransposon Copia-like N-terminal domain-containing protein n=1 Tax=Malus domestica TaxID=3750 RepID=A0A498HR98_MALDO|nr:hypothetical protein DVH24_021248 [Malus domestica]
MAEEDSVNIESGISHTSPSNFSDVEFNYLTWSRAVSLALGGKGKLGFVNGSVEPLDISSSTYGAWLCKDQLVMSLLLNTMEKHVAKIFSYYNSSCELWKTLQDMYGNQNNYARVFQLKKDIPVPNKKGKIRESETHDAITRGDVWIRGHIRKSSEFLNKEVATKKIQEANKNLTDVGKNSIKNDALAKALGPKRRGRVRGLRFGATPSQVSVQTYNRERVIMLEKELEDLKILSIPY